MEQQLRRYFVGIIGFAFVITWATLGATNAVVATIACIAGANLHRLLPEIGGKQLGRRPKRSRIAARPLRDELRHAHDLVPDDPSLIISTQS